MSGRYNKLKSIPYRLLQNFIFISKAKPLGEKVKETVKTTSYLGVIVIGVGVTAIMFYAIFSELFGSSSPQAVYADAFDKCKDDPRVQVRIHKFLY